MTEAVEAVGIHGTTQNRSSEVVGRVLDLAEEKDRPRISLPRAEAAATWVVEAAEEVEVAGDHCPDSSLHHPADVPVTLVGRAQGDLHRLISAFREGSDGPWRGAYDSLLFPP